MTMKVQKRQYWGKIDLPLPELDLLSVQKESYSWFLSDGVRLALEENSPVLDSTEKNWKLTFGKHKLGVPLLSPKQAMAKGLTYEAPLKVETTLTNLKTNET